MAGFDLGLFAPSTAPIGGTKSNVPQSALGAISKATTLQDENPFDSITQPLRKRKRRQVAQDLAKRGVEVGTPEYFKEFRDKLIEFGDNEGAEIIETKRREYLKENVALDAQRSLMKRREGLTSIGQEKNVLKGRDLDIKELDTTSKVQKRAADIERDMAKLDNEIARTGIMQQNANTSAERAQIAAYRADLQAARDEQTNRLRKAQARGKELENEFLDKHGYLPTRAGRQSVANKAKAAGGKLSQATSLIDQLETRLKNAAKKDGPGLGIPGDSVSGFEGWLRSTFGGIANQVVPGWDPGKGADVQTQGYQYLQSLLVPILLNEKRVTDQDRERVEKIVGNLSPGRSNLQNQRQLKQLEAFISTMPDLKPGESNFDTGGEGSDVNDPTSLPDMPFTEDNPAQPLTQEEFDLLPSGAIFINPADGQKRRKE